MNSINVFDNFIRSETVDHERLNVSQFYILNNAHYAEAATTRKMINHLFRHYPDSEKPDIRARLRSEKNESFRSALFELIIYHALVRMGMSAKPHPQLPNGATERPDFFVTTAGGDRFYLEATMAQDRVESSRSGEKLIESMIRTVDSVPSDDFLLQLRFSGSPKSNPKLGSLKDFVANQLESLEYEALRARLESGDQLDGESLVWKFDGGSVRITPKPVLPAFRGSFQCSVGGTSGYGGGWRDGMMPIFRKLESKRKHYGVLDHPLVVSLDCASILMRTDELMTALFGENYGRSRSSVAPGLKGAFSSGVDSQRRLAAVWVFHRLNPANLVEFDHCLIVNHYQPVELPSELYRLPHYSQSGEDLILQQGLTASSLMPVLTTGSDDECEASIKSRGKPGQETQL